VALSDIFAYSPITLTDWRNAAIIQQKHDKNNNDTNTTTLIGAQQNNNNSSDKNTTTISAQNNNNSSDKNTTSIKAQQNNNNIKDTAITDQQNNSNIKDTTSIITYQNNKNNNDKNFTVLVRSQQNSKNNSSNNNNNNNNNNNSWRAYQVDELTATPRKAQTYTRRDDDEEVLSATFTPIPILPFSEEPESTAGTTDGSTTGSASRTVRVTIHENGALRVRGAARTTLEAVRMPAATSSASFDVSLLQPLLAAQCSLSELLLLDSKAGNLFLLRLPLLPPPPCVCLCFFVCLLGLW
jgi:hypothetical protein